MYSQLRKINYSICWNCQHESKQNGNYCNKCHDLNNKDDEKKKWAKKKTAR